MTWPWEPDAPICADANSSGTRTGSRTTATSTISELRSLAGQGEAPSVISPDWPECAVTGPQYRRRRHSGTVGYRAVNLHRRIGSAPGPTVAMSPAGQRGTPSTTRNRADARAHPRFARTRGLLGSVVGTGGVDEGPHRRLTSDSAVLGPHGTVKARAGSNVVAADGGQLDMFEADDRSNPQALGYDSTAHVGSTELGVGSCRQVTACLPGSRSGTQ